MDWTSNKDHFPCSKNENSLICSKVIPQYIMPMTFHLISISPNKHTLLEKAFCIIISKSARDGTPSGSMSPTGTMTWC